MAVVANLQDAAQSRAPIRGGLISMFNSFRNSEIGMLELVKITPSSLRKLMVVNARILDLVGFETSKMRY